MDPHSAALVGFLFSLPFVITNFIVSSHIEPLYSFLGSFPSVRKSPFLPLALLLLFPIGAFISIRPMLYKGANGKRKIYILNTILAVILIGFFLLFFLALGEEMYRCNVLKVPNCD